MFKIATYSNVGGRANNEDTVMAVRHGEERICAVVADGLGGHGGGELASARAAELICGRWAGQVDKDVLTNLVLAANDAVIAMQTPQCSMKTTLVALTAMPGRAVWAHDGDSRLYRFHDGKLEFQTTDHSSAQIGVMLGQITPDQLRFHPDRSRVLRALGQDSELKVEVGSCEILPGRTAFLLCTDGFWEYVLEEEMAKDLRAAKDPEDWIARMRKRLASKVSEGNDNNSAAAVWIDL